MPERFAGKLRSLIGLVLVGCVATSGCGHLGPLPVAGTQDPPPNESSKLPLPPYRIAPPDVLLINAITLLPKPNRPIKPLDIIRVQFPSKTLTADELKLLSANNLAIDVNFAIELDGNLTIGPPYDLVINLYNMTVAEAEVEIAKQLKKIANEKLVDKGGVKVRMVQAQGLQLIQGQHLVRPDGNINLGIYGSVYITGLTIEEARLKIQEHLAKDLMEPAISLDVTGYNSTVYYVIYDGGGLGEQVVRLPVTGNETVLDAVGLVNGLPAVASKSLIWICRPSYDGREGAVLPVDWKAISERGVAKANYQMMPGDRLYVKADPLVTLNTKIDRLVSPIERVMGALLLGTSTYRSFKTANQTSTGSASGF